MPTSGRPAIARSVAEVTRLRRARLSSLRFDTVAQHHRSQRRVRQILAEAALIVLGHRRPLHFIALVEEGEPEGGPDLAENAGVFGPGDHRPRRHHGGNIAVDEAGPGEVGQLDHCRYLLATVPAPVGR